MSLAPPDFAKSPLAGIDFSWIAVDQDDHVAWLVTFGSAVVPPWVRDQAAMFDDVEAALGALPQLGRCTAENLADHAEQWRAAAAAGVFAYDWDVYRGPYKIVAAPENPLRAEQLPAELAQLARRTRFAGLCFRSAAELSIAQVLTASPHRP